MEELKTLGTIAVALFGVFLTHRFTSKRDVENSQRTVRIGALTILNKTGMFVYRCLYFVLVLQAIKLTE